MIIERDAHMFSSDTERYPFHQQAVHLPDESRWEQGSLEIYLKWMEAGVRLRQTNSVLWSQPQASESNPSRPQLPTGLD